MATILDYVGGLVLPGTTATGSAADPATVLADFRRDFYGCLTARADALFELTDAVLCTDGVTPMAFSFARYLDRGRTGESDAAGRKVFHLMKVVRKFSKDVS